MSEHFVPGVGAVLSADIAVPEHERELRFYRSVLTTGENPLWGKHGKNNVGVPILGLGKRTPEFAGLPLQWMPHIQVADVGASVERAVALGGSVLMHDEAGRWAVLADPNGAAFGIIPVVQPDALPPSAGGGALGAGAVGRIAWLDLTVPDAPATRDFFREVVGWSVEEVAMDDGGERYADYNMLAADGRPAAGVCHARGVNADLPPVWMLYIPVGDLAGSLRRVEEEGGSVLKTVKGKDGQPVYAAVRDPVGVYLALAPG